MRNRYARLSIALIAVLITVSHAPAVISAMRRDKTNVLPLLMPSLDTETTLALGLRLPLGCIDLWSLELIPNLSGRVAERVVTQREAILTVARTTSPERALQSVYGVGTATARLLSNYVSITDNCQPSLKLYSPYPNDALKH